MDLQAIETQRQTLEQSLATLKAHLKHWQTWEAEYEGLKEEIDSVPGNVDVTALESISKTYGGTLLNEKEIRDLTGLSKGSPLGASQILGLISRRQDYVQKNIDTLQRQFWDAEARLEEFDFIASSGSRDADAGFPLTEINEELDDDDNVISSSVFHPEDSKGKIYDSLRKAGLSKDDLSDLTPNKSVAQKASEKPVKPAISAPAVLASAETLSKPVLEIRKSNDEAEPEETSLERPSLRKKSVSFTADTKPSTEPARVESEDGRRSVSFAEKVAIAPAAPTPDSRSVSFAAQIEEIPPDAPDTPSQPKPTDPNIQKTLRASFKPGEKVYEIGDDDESVTTHFVLPENESEEDARLRREMIDYNLNEVGHIVAELDLEEEEMDGEDTASASDFTSSEHPDEDTPYTSGMSDSDSEDEDEFGRSIKPSVSEDYHETMKRLEAKLIGNLGPAPATMDVATAELATDPAHVRKLVIREEQKAGPASATGEDKHVSNRKRVSFAEALDVAPSDFQPIKATKMKSEENAPPVTDARSTGILRSVPSTVATQPKTRTPAASLIVSTILDTEDGDDEETGHTGPAGKIMVDQLMERPTANKDVVAPSADDFDPVMQRRELAEAYYRRRNEIIRQQGGFLPNPDDEDEHEPEMEVRDGKVKKVSRFKAARIKS